MGGVGAAATPKGGDRDWLEAGIFCWWFLLGVELLLCLDARCIKQRSDSWLVGTIEAAVAGRQAAMMLEGRDLLEDMVEQSSNKAR